MHEFRLGWKVVLASMLGVGLTGPILLSYTMGLFGPELQEAFDWDLFAIQLSGLCIIATLLVCLPIVNKLYDKFGVRPVAVVSIIISSLGIMALSLLPNNIYVLYALTVLIAFGMSGALPIAWTRMVSIWFDERRGLALGLTLLGTGVGATVLKLYTDYFIDAFSWRVAYVALGALPLIIVLPLAIAWFREPQDGGFDADQNPDPNATGMSLGEALKTWQFWTLSLAFVPIAFVVAGIIANLEIILESGGLPEHRVVSIASTFGIFVIIGRVSGGYLLDRINPALVGSSLIAILAVSCFLMAQPQIGVTAAFIAVALAGLGTGVELDVLAYFAGRLFGLKNYTKIYSALFGSFMIASALGPATYALVYDRTESYVDILWPSAFAVIAGSALIGVLAQAFNNEYAAPKNH